MISGYILTSAFVSFRLISCLSYLFIIGTGYYWTGTETREIQLQWYWNHKLVYAKKWPIVSENKSDIVVAGYLPRGVGEYDAV